MSKKKMNKVTINTTKKASPVNSEEPVVEMSALEIEMEKVLAESDAIIKELKKLLGDN